MVNPNFNASIRGDSDSEVKSLYNQARKRKEDKIKYHLLSELLEGKVIDLTKSAALYQAINREKMDFEALLKLHPEETTYHVKYVKQRKEEQLGKWYNADSPAKWGEKGVVPPCCYYARPNEYWNDKKLMNNFLNTFPKFRISEKAL